MIHFICVDSSFFVVVVVVRFVRPETNSPESFLCLVCRASHTYNESNRISCQINSSHARSHWIVYFYWFRFFSLPFNYLKFRFPWGNSKKKESIHNATMFLMLIFFFQSKMYLLSISVYCADKFRISCCCSLLSNGKKQIATLRCMVDVIYQLVRPLVFWSKM